MAIRAFRRELSAPTTAEQVFHAVFSSDDCLVWVDVSGPSKPPHSVLGRGELHELSGPDALEDLRRLWVANALELGKERVPLGLMVVLPYDLSALTLQHPGEWRVPEDWDEPLRVVALHQSISVDWSSGVATAWMRGDDEEDFDHEEFDHYVRRVEKALASRATPTSDVPQPAGRARWRDTPPAYRGMIASAREAIRDGEAYQLCVTTQVTVDSDLSDWQLHSLLRRVSPAPHQALLRLGGVSMVSASPETFLHLDRDRTLTTRPIKGTRPRGESEEDDQRLMTELLQSEKEQAENLMIVDLMRNDFLQVCAVDSVRVAGLFEVETFSTVHQLVSTVTGVLDEGYDGIDALRACFPAGSMTGAPKSRAVRLLTEWESGPRGIYSGAWGWLHPDLSMELAMTIRTAIFADGVVRIGTGGGITWSSQVDEEIAEVGHKAKSLLEALGVSTIAYS
ncbi:anthranilate synthase component I family protein [Pontimonas sp.]|uniref:anthranilate synthase component I family protein n=1 Tax=Pontimonas sp. TaxID=2304492 RepID=UPI002870AC4A|nr:anthranilate synthase component I family protein [Pontimonas sp.]MDR9395927.1 anthranilate synthase component I family protein [Pontimonas sp.]